MMLRSLKPVVIIIRWSGLYNQSFDNGMLTATQIGNLHTGLIAENLSNGFLH